MLTQLEADFMPLLASWWAIPVIFVVRFISCLLAEGQTILVVFGKAKSATLLAGIEDTLYWASIGLVVHETGRGYL
ncbi:hypothetical protein HY522_04425 [bacterium]|nr:hypothetical protein [bacterium]